MFTVRSHISEILEITIHLTRLSKMADYLIFEEFEDGKYIHEEDIPKMVNYICGHLISWLPNVSYFECQYNYATKAKIVCTWKRKRSLTPCAKNGEAIYGGKLVNFFREK